jgi:hypothetical protein
MSDDELKAELRFAAHMSACDPKSHATKPAKYRANSSMAQNWEFA